MPAFEIHPTPNPNSLKITRDGFSFLDGGMETFDTPAQAAGHPLAFRLLEIEGIANVFILPQFLTITRKPFVDWDELLPAVEAVLATEWPGTGA